MTSKCEHRSGFCHLDHIKLRPAAHICNRMFNFQICFSASDNLTYIRRKSHHMAVQSNPSSNAKFVKTKKFSKQNSQSSQLLKKIGEKYLENERKGSFQIWCEIFNIGTCGINLNGIGNEIGM